MLSRQQALHQRLHRLVFIEFMVCIQGIMGYIEMLQEDARGAGIFRQYHIRLLQDSDGPERHVLHVAHGCGNDIQYAHFHILQ